MLSYLIDTHVLLWSALSPEKLSSKVRRVIEDSDNTIYCSPISIVEIGIKISIKRLDFPILQINKILEQLNFKELKLSVSQVKDYANLPLKHHDPFDRIIILQALSENLPLITKDKEIRGYKVDTVW